MLRGSLEKWPITTFRELLPRLYMRLSTRLIVIGTAKLEDSNGITEPSPQQQ